MAAGLTTHLLQAGFGPDSVLRMVNTALMVKSGTSLATLDVASIDLFTGRLESFKAGASVSLLRSKGIVPGWSGPPCRWGSCGTLRSSGAWDTLVDGDILLLASDGVVSAGVGWVEEALRDFDLEQGGVQELAESIAYAARQKQKGQREG